MTRAHLRGGKVATFSATNINELHALTEFPNHVSFHYKLGGEHPLGHHVPHTFFCFGGSISAPVVLCAWYLSWGCWGGAPSGAWECGVDLEALLNDVSALGGDGEAMALSLADCSMPEWRALW